MSLLKYALPALAAVGTASAACSASATATIQNSGDASALASCQTFSGNLAIATGTTDAINLAGVRQIKGSLIVDGAPNITSISADSLESITETFFLNNVQTLADLSMPRLTEVNKIQWQGLPNLGSLDFGTQVQLASVIDIQNTLLSSLKGINVQQADSIILANNLYLQDISLQIGNISTGLEIGRNGDRLTVDLPNLIWAQNLTFRNSPSISLASLEAVNGSLGFYENTLESIACPNLTKVDGSLSFVTNGNLNNISFPKLSKIGGAFQIANNTKLEKINQFPEVESVGGALDFYGNYTEVDLPALNDVRGAFNMQSSGDIQKICQHFDSMKGPSKPIKGKYTCAGSQTNPRGAGSSPSAAGSKSSKGAAPGGLDVSSSAVMGITGLLAAMLGLL